MSFGEIPSIFSAVTLFIFGVISLGLAHLQQKGYDHKKLGTTKASLLWVILFYYFSAFGAFYGGAYELFLVLIGKPYELHAYPILMQIRVWNLCYSALTSTFMYTGLMVGSGKEKFMTVVLYIFIAVVSFLAPGSFFADPSDKTHWTKLTLSLISLIYILMLLVFRCRFGGWTTTGLFILSNIFKILCIAVFGVDTPTRNILFHSFVPLAFIMQYFGIVAALRDEPRFPAIVMNNVTFPWIYAIIFTLVGWVLMGFLSYQDRDTYWILEDNVNNVTTIE